MLCLSLKADPKGAIRTFQTNMTAKQGKNLTGKQKHRDAYVCAGKGNSLRRGISRI